MKENLTITIKLKLIMTPEEKKLLDQTTLSYRNALNIASKYCFDNWEKKPSARKYQDQLYYTIRNQFDLGAQMTQSVYRRIKGDYQGQWTKWKQNQQHKARGYTKKDYKGLDNPPIYASRTLELVHGRDYTVGSDNSISIGTLEGRVRLTYQGWDKHLSYLKNSNQWKRGTAKLWYNKANKTYFLLVPLTKNVEMDRNSMKEVMGVDVGMRYLVVAEGNKKPIFVSGKQVREKKKHYQRLRSELQRKGTRSAKRRLIQISGRETRFISDVNHKISALLKRTGRVIGMEDLTGIRQKISTYNKDKEQRRQKEQWSYADLHSKLAYKALFCGGYSLKVDPHYTSQCCPKCGHTIKENRPNKGLLFVCQSCKYTLHSDLVGSRNIKNRTRKMWQAI